MKLKNAFTGRPALAAVVALILVLTGCATKTPKPVSEPSAPAVGPAKAPAGTVVLEYKMPNGRALTYQGKSDEAQVMEVMGQAMDTHTASTNTFTFKAAGTKDKNFLLGVTLDDIVVTVTSSAQGDLSPDMASLKGKSFNMVLSPLGSEVDVAGAEALSYEMGGESRNLSAGFKVFFPDLAGKPVKIGDTWPSSSSVEEKTGSMVIKVDLQNVNTLEGFENVDGKECAKISSDVTGTISGTGNQGGMDMTFSGTSKGKDVWYFAVKEGIYIKGTSESTTQMSIDVSAAGMTIPMTMTSKSEVKLTGKA